MVISQIAQDETLERLERHLQTAQGVVHLSGLWGSSAPMVIAHLASRVGRPVLYVTAHLEEADHVRDDLELFLKNSCHVFPAWEALPGEGTAAGEIEAERLRLCRNLHRRSSHTPSDPELPPPIIAPIQALMQPVPTVDELIRNTIRLQPGRLASETPTKTPTGLLEWAVDRGFERLDLVESPGDVAMRGDIVDIFVAGENAPFRVEFFDDEIESIRQFDPSTQRSIERVLEIEITARLSTAPQDSRQFADLLTYLPHETLVILDSPAEIQEMGQTLARRLLGDNQLFDVEEVLRRTHEFTTLHLARLGGSATSSETTFDFRVHSTTRFEDNARDAVAELCALADDHAIHVFCDNEGEKQRLAQMIAELSPERSREIQLHLGTMHRGFVWTDTNVIVVSHHEIFGRQRQRRRIRKISASKPLESWTDLQPGHHVVHVIHGIAIYRGLSKLSKGASDQTEEFLSLEFADKAMIHVPVSQVDLVQTYIGAAARRPQLSKLGGKRWSRTKEQVQESVVDLAESLLRVQAARRDSAGTAFPPDTEWQREFEASFLYEETEDQLIVAKEIKDDLVKPRSMDRLICGDVGYGKTELAMRAAFKVVEYGRQVALLVPTTVLAEQHYETFRERFADYPFVVGCLSRFRKASEQKIIVDKTKKGQIDIVVGTHRLLSKDVAFANLGLVIIDEEQRFGVGHKERLKEMRETVDILTLTATPIPRTLHMSMVGIRDISALQTPPVDRRSIGTQVRQFDHELIRNAILREMNRDGQVFFVHNFVHSIAAMADTVRAIVPEARVVYGHGQMKAHELEKVMHSFSQREADVLVATTIIESGIDIPSANTIFINRADRFGLADLHQLRGRVGRSSHHAYCYLLLSPNHTSTPKAAKRLKTIEEFSELGAGFRIAMRDLEIRGAGNLLGAEQSGHIAAVGYEMYCRLLDQTVRKLKNEPDPTPPAVHIDLDVAAHVPPHYISADKSRIEVYRRITGCYTIEDLNQLETDLVDAFGKYPKPVDALLQLADVRVRCRDFGIGSISLREPDIVFTFCELRKVEPLFIDAPGTVRMPDDKTIHLRLPENYLEPDTLLPVLRRMFVRASDRVGSLT